MKTIRCKKCRFVLCPDTASSIVEHSMLPLQEVGFRPSPTCSHWFITQQPWMQEQVEGPVKGTMYCKCGGKVGDFDWAGWPCGCGHWVVPAFALNKSKVDVI
jgi:dual specificity phosphatase 12